MEYTQLETQRMILKNIDVSDLDFIYKQFSDEIVTKYLYDTEPVKTMDEAMEIIELYTLQETMVNHRWIMIDKENQNKIGTCGFHCYEKSKNKIEIGYDLQESYWKKGYMKEAVDAILKYAKDYLHIEYIEAVVSIDNINSIKFVEKLGFEISGTMIEDFRNEKYLHNIYQLKL